MERFEQLVKALRCGQIVAATENDCKNCPYFIGGVCAWTICMSDAAAAIEELDAEETRLLMITSELQDKVVELEEELNDADVAADDNARQIEALQAEVERLKDCNDELREAQTYIDHYGDKWRTSAKDVPTSAYNHGYMDGKNEAEQALEPKRGEWILCGPVGWPKWECSVCHSEGRGDYIRCPWCGAKMEVQDEQKES